MQDWVGQGVRLVGIALASIWQYALLKRGAAAQRRAKVRVKQLEGAIAILSRLTSLHNAAQSAMTKNKSWNVEGRTALQASMGGLYTQTATIIQSSGRDFPRELHDAIAHFMAVYNQLLTADPQSVEVTVRALDQAFQLTKEQMQLQLNIDLSQG